MFVSNPDRSPVGKFPAIYQSDSDYPFNVAVAQAEGAVVG
jgi:hypothetical protein